MLQSDIQSLPLIARGKVRDMYAVGDDKLLIVTTDRISAFDVILQDPIPGKGKVLTELTNFWLNKLSDLMPNHSTGIDPADVVNSSEVNQVRGRAVVVKRLQPVLVEAVVRGYISGSGWNDYKATGQVCGVSLPEGLLQSQRLATPIFTPAAKAEVGEHDENISYTEMRVRIGGKLADEIRDAALEIYKQAYDYAATKGLIIADTKFEFGLDNNGVLHLMDEVLTPDSSRFWANSDYIVGDNPPSFDKQYLRDWLLSQPWDKTHPAPRLPQEVIDKTADKYQQALHCLAGDNND